MKKVESKQEQVVFIFCKEPTTIDKSSSWGEGNIQNFPNGVFLKVNNDNEITHGVQPNKDFSAPVGWVKTDKKSEYKKQPIWVGEKLIKGQQKTLQTLDGEITYKVEEDSYICYNGKQDPILNDSWIQTQSELEKNYNI